MAISLAPSNPFVRVIYCTSLIFIAFSLLRIFGAFNYKPGGELMVAAAIAPTVILLLLVVFRFVGVVIGKFKLNVAATSGPIYILRMVAIFLMIASGSVAVFSVIGMLMSSRSAGAGFALVSGILGGGSPIGLLLFEASRLLERELLIEPTKT
jgi:small-conductance mechanosensitive channel